MKAVLKRGGLPAIAIIVLSMLVAPLPGGAQQPAKVPRVGLLLQGTSASLMARLEGFRQGLRERGYVEGKTIALEERFDEDREERLPALAADLVHLQVDVIVAAATPAVKAAQRVTTTIPIVIVHSADPVGLGFATSLARPSGNITGLSSMSPELSGKRLQLLKEAVPKLSRIAVLWNAANPGTAIAFEELQDAARVLRLRVQSLEVRRIEDLAPAVKGVTGQRTVGLVTLLDPLVVSQRVSIVELAAEKRLPAMYPTMEFVKAGGLMAYGPDLVDSYRRAAIFVDKILKGAKPADLPVEQPTKFNFAINLKTAKALGLTFPRFIRVRADEVIQ
jgi:putative ABC transport system substrate-binding protein